MNSFDKNLKVGKFIIENVSKTYVQTRNNVKEYKEVLKNINIKIFENEITVIVGKSGCGKTTFLKIIAGLEKATEGKVKYLDSENNEKDVKIGVVFQEPRLMPWLTVEKNIKIHEKKDSSEKIDIEKILSLVSLNNIENMYPHELSGGMASRVAIARAIAYNPQILLMDEPFAALDYFTRAQLQNEIIKIHQETKTGIIFVTHNIDEAILIGKRIIVFIENNNGKNKYEEFVINKSYPRDMGDIELINIKKEILNRLV